MAGACLGKTNKEPCNEIGPLAGMGFGLEFGCFGLSFTAFLIAVA